jgi:iron only hydrogenase large subunit-like protein
MEALNPIYTERAECQDCYKCLRECTVKAIKVEGGRAAVVPELCVLCGHCIEVCPVGAKRVRNDLPRVRRLLEIKKRVIVSLAPSFASEFPSATSEQLVAALRKLGFFAVSETARGADLVARRVAQDLAYRHEAPEHVPSSEEHYHERGDRRCEARILISSACTAELSPEENPDHLRVFIGPCLAKRKEGLDDPLIDYVLSVEELGALFVTMDIDAAEIEGEVVNRSAASGGDPSLGPAVSPRQ